MRENEPSTSHKQLSNDLVHNRIITTANAWYSEIFEQNSVTGISIKIYCLCGGTVFTIDHLLSTEIDISSLNSGLYILEIIRGSDIISTKLMIQK